MDTLTPFEMDIVQEALEEYYNSVHYSQEYGEEDQAHKLKQIEFVASKLSLKIELN